MKGARGGLSVTGGEWGWWDPELLRLIDEPAAGLPLLGVLLAVGVGVAHALGPGHGKALIGMYFAGTPGRIRDTVALGAIVALLHTGSVLALGFALHRLQAVPLGAQLGPVVSVATGVAVALLGFVLLVRAWRAPHPTAPHAAGGPSAQASPAQPDADTVEGHARLPAGVPPWSWAGLVVLAGTGGLLPSPVALLVVTTALALGRGGYGLTLVAAFGVGMACTLTGVGVLARAGRAALLRATRRRRVASAVAVWLPRVSATGVLLAGALLAGTALATWSRLPEV